MSQPVASTIPCPSCGANWPLATRACPVDGTKLGDGTVVLEPSPQDLPQGTIVGEYVIENLLGAGGMGEVYGARHPVIGKQVAIKVMSRACSSNPANVDRFVQEAKAVNAIGHANIVDIFAFGRTADDRCYFVMEWLRGESVRARMKRGLSFGEVIDILDGVLRALEAAHGAGIVHRDLKPDNIFVVASRDGDPERVKLLDFGIAKLSEDSPVRSSRTQTGTVVGTPDYMSPEQAGGGVVERPSDIYSLGVVAFELVTGRLPFVADTMVQIMSKHLAEKPPAPSSIRAAATPFESLILSMLDKKQMFRPTAAAVRNQLAALRTRIDHKVVNRAASDPGAALALTTPLSLATVEPPPPLPASPSVVDAAVPPAPRRRVALAAGALAVVAVAIVVVVVAASTGAKRRSTPAAAAPPPTHSEPPPARIEPPPAPTPSAVPAAPARGTLAVEVRPADAAIELIDTAGSVRKIANASAITADPGTYQVVASHKRLERETRTVEIAADKKTSLSITLRARTSPAKAKPPAPAASVASPKPPPAPQKRPDVDAVRDPFEQGGSR